MSEVTGSYNAATWLLDRNVVDALPKTATGKIQRFKLRERVH